MEIGKLFKAARIRQKLRQNYVAEAAGISQGLLSKIEAGKLEARITVAFRIAKVLGLSPEALQPGKKGKQ